MNIRIIATLLLCFSLSMAWGQGNITRNKSKEKTQHTETTKAKKQPKQVTTTTPKKKSSTTPEASGYDVAFSSNVSNATMYIDGTNYGNPSGTRYLKSGKHTIKLSASGYEDYTEDISVGRSNVSFSFSMKKLATEQIFTVKGVTFEMVKVEGGTFLMGATSEQGSGAKSEEKPVHTVTLSSYYIGKTEVTQELWQAVMGTTVQQQRDKVDKSRNLYGVGGKQPMYYISWDECNEFINKLNSLTGKTFRMPTEAEWEFACRGGNKSKGYKYSGSNNLDDVAWYWKNSGDKKLEGTDDYWDSDIIKKNNCKTHEVASLQPNELGIYDMSGNVWEWCSDWYGKYSSNAQTNPTGPASGSTRVNRGGSWYGSAGYCRSSDRGGNTPGGRGNPLGLRLACSE